MNIIDVIKHRILPDGLETITVVVKPVAEKWNDGKVHKTDNLQLTLKSTSDSPLTDVMAYLYYYDKNGKELSHEFDITENKIKPGAEARVSFLLEIPAECSYAQIEIKAESEAEEKKKELKLNLVICCAIIALVLALLYVGK